MDWQVKSRPKEVNTKIMSVDLTVKAVKSLSIKKEIKLFKYFHINNQQMSNKT